MNSLGIKIAFNISSVLLGGCYLIYFFWLLEIRIGLLYLTRLGAGYMSFINLYIQSNEITLSYKISF